MSQRQWKIGCVVLLVALGHTQAWSKTKHPDPAALVDAKGVAEKLIKPNMGRVAAVLTEKGAVVFVNAKGEPLQSCLPCSKELENQLGPRCEDRAKLSLWLKQNPDIGATKVCDKFINTTVRSLTTVTFMEHTGSDCTAVATMQIGADGRPRPYYGDDCP